MQATPKNTHNRGKYHCTTDLLFDWFGFYKTTKTVFNSTKSKQLNPNKINMEVNHTVMFPTMVSVQWLSDPGSFE